MERNTEAFCPKRHLAVSLCFNKGCKNSALICSEQNCEFSVRKHLKCLIINVSHILEQLVRKGRSAAEILDPFIEQYRNLIKKIERDLLEYEKSRPQTGFKLEGDQDKLFKYLRQGQVDKILPQLVHTVNQSLKNQPLTLRNDDIDQMVKEEIDKVDQVLQSMKATWKKTETVSQNTNQIKCYFDENLRNKQHTTIKENNKVIQLKDNIFGSQAFTISLTQRNSKINFKINKLSNLYLCLGLKSLNKQNYFKSKTYGVYQNGKTLNPSNKNQSFKQSSFLFKTNDIIEIQCNMYNHRITFTNKTTLCPVLNLDFVKKQNDTIHFGVFGYNSQVQITDY